MNFPFRTAVGRAPRSSRKPVAVVTTGRFSADHEARREVDCVTLSLPMPTSANGLFANSSRGGRFKTQEYEDWIRESGWRIQAQHPGRIAGPYQIEIVVSRPPDRRRRDLANFEKGIGDLLVRHRIIADDSLCERLTMFWSPEGEGVLVTLTKAGARA
jgi:crossover junction endodeoxyribonuclease RusA